MASLRVAANWAVGTLALLLVLSLILPPSAILDVISNLWPYLAVPLLAFGLIVIRQRPLLAALCGITGAIVLFLCVRSLNPINLAHEPSLELGGDEHLKVISFNVLDQNRTRADDVLNFLIAQEADFAFVQEAEGIVVAVGGIVAFRRRLRQVYPYVSGCEPGRECSSLLLSRRPLLSVRRPEAPVGYERFVIARAKALGRSITLVGIHVTKPLEEQDQEWELKRVGDVVRELPRPLILAGDFNATPWSWPLRRFLRRANLAYPYGYQPTWPTWLPGLGLPIDHIIVAGLDVVNVQVSPDSIGSNHFPLIVEIAPP